jgi:hypothetical protein
MKRTYCVSEDGGLLLEVLTFKQFPVHIGGTDEGSQFDVFHDMTWGSCEECGMLQLTDLPSQDLVYKEQSTIFAVGPTWERHHQAFAKFISDSMPSAVLEIGGAHGVLSVEFTRRTGKNIGWRIIEPNPSPIPECNAIFIEGYFEAVDFDLLPIDMVVHSHVLEHALEPSGFLRAATEKMQLGQKMAVSIPNLKKWFEKGHPNALNFEHTYLLTDFVAEYLFERSGLSVLKREDFGGGHSIFYILERIELTGNQKRKLEFNDQATKQLLNNFSLRQQFVEMCNRDLESHLGDAYLFGGSIFSQQLINLGLNVDSIVNVLDNDPSKDGKRLYGSNLQIKPPSCISSSSSPLVIVDCGEYNEEILRQLLALNNEAKVLVFNTSKGVSQFA